MEESVQESVQDVVQRAFSLLRPFDLFCPGVPVADIELLLEFFGGDQIIDAQ